MTEPFLTFLVEAVWSSGRLLREYTVLLDPPTFAPVTETPGQPEVVAPRRSTATDSGQIERRPAPTPTPAPAVSEAETRSETVRAQPPATSSTESAPKPQPPRDTTPYDDSAGGDYTVERGQTLWGIASAIRPDSRLTMNQTMLAIFEANPEAFGGNINILRAGARLRIPSADEIYRIDRGAAFTEAQRQNEAWSGGVVPPAVQPTPAPAAETRPSLTLVPPDEEPAGIETGMDGEITDDSAVREQEILDRIAEIEAVDVPEQRSLIEIRDNELASLRQELADLRGEVYEPPVAETEDEPFVEDEAGDELFPDYGEVTDDAATADADDSAADTTAEAPDSTTIVQRSSRDESLVDKLLGWLNSIWVWIGAALLVAVGILVWFMRRGGGDDDGDVWGERLDRNDGDVETLAATESLRAPRRHDESIVVVEQGRRSKVVEEDTLEAVAPNIDESTLETGRFESLEDTFSSDTAVNLDQSDPIAEADFHMAYGLYDQAADLINGALQSEPKRQDLLTKLCEIYFVWGNRNLFIEAAEKLQRASGGEAEEWDKIVIMGQQIAADYPLFAGAGVTGVTRAIDLALDDEPEGTGALDMDFGDDAGGDEVIDLGSDDEDDGVDFLFDDNADSDADTGTARQTTEPTMEMARRDRTVETPTIEEQFAGLDSTNELPNLSRKSKAIQADATAEIDLDDLGLELDGLDETELASLDDNDATELASLDDFDSDETGTRDALSNTSATARNRKADTSATGMMGALQLDDELLESTGMRLADDETGQNPMI
jgi:pilus assembly protein FimV